MQEYVTPGTEPDNLEIWYNIHINIISMVINTYCTRTSRWKERTVNGKPLVRESESDPISLIAYLIYVIDIQHITSTNLYSNNMLIRYE